MRHAGVFLYGHSLGALLAVLWLLERPAAPVAGAVVSAIGLHSALKEQAAKVRAARVLGRAVPRVRVKSGIDPDTLSRDPAVVAAYRADKLVHDIVSLGFGPTRWRRSTRSSRARPASPCRCSSSTAARTRSPTSAARASSPRSRPAVTTLRVYDGLFHEIHHEPEQARVFNDVRAWMRPATR